MKILPLIIVALVVGTGCSSGGGLQLRKVAFVLPPSYSKAESDDKEVTIGVPSGWRQGANNMFGTTNPFDAMGAANSVPTTQTPTEDSKKLEELSKGLSEAVKEDELKNLDKLKQKGIILHVVSTGKPTIGEELTRFYVKKKSQGGNWTWTEADASEQDCFLNKQKATEVKLPIGLAHKMQATWQQSDGSNYTQISYLIPSGRDLYVLRFITVEQPEVVTSIEKEVAQSFRVN